MKQFQVPQFIDIEDKIIGPLTLRQFLYLLGGGAIVVVARALFVPFLFYIISFFVLGLSFALAFYKVNGIPFPKIIAAALSYLSRPRLYIWKQEELPSKKPSVVSAASTAPAPKATESKLEDLAWSLDIKEKIEERH